MAPVQGFGDIPVMSVKRADAQGSTHDTLKNESPSGTLNYLVARTTSTSTSGKVAYGQGTIDPSHIKNQGLLALFALIGAAFVVAGIWFFFWAKNGGFIWRKGDWDDYKSTVLRRKGPDGRTLSNATKSTKLGGGSVVGKGYSDDGYTYTDCDGYTEAGTAITEEKPKKKRNFKEKFLRRHKDERYEGEGDADVRAYREEKPARIGGMNRQADGTYHGSDYDSSAVPSNYQQSEMSEVRDYAYEQPREPRRSKRRDPSGFSFTAGSEDVISQTTEESRLTDPTQRRQNRRRERAEREERSRRRSAAPPTERAPPSAPSSRTSSPRKKDRRSAPGKYTEPLDFSSAGTRSEYQYSNVDTEDSGHKAYHHPIPGLTQGYRRGRGEGGRRRRDSLSDSEGDET
ncbi:54S ribosomal protein L24 [Penicillium atrosanguineum]|uniref:54S ribosomal protein L24 n=1 Tax=Penicillium atrosanguineum TaxID=1132637 RepID=UPI0023A67E62|nr:54S ribosomal protein L24 [Penicillium atrosanguineum]KAJ5298934.1 54S ribosomal protein L24 [Penicillium atrosanguineum]